MATGEGQHPAELAEGRGQDHDAFHVQGPGEQAKNRAGAIAGQQIARVQVQALGQGLAQVQVLAVGMIAHQGQALIQHLVQARRGAQGIQGGGKVQKLLDRPAQTAGQAPHVTPVGGRLLIEMVLIKVLRRILLGRH